MAGSSFNSLSYNAERVRDAGMSVESSVVGGVDVRAAILTPVAEWQPDLIALTTTKSSEFHRWLDGSDSEQMIKSTTVPVLLVPPHWERPHRAGWGQRSEAGRTRRDGGGGSSRRNGRELLAKANCSSQRSRAVR
jgi:hypothetical protein